MRRTPVLEQLAGELADAKRLGMVPAPDTVARWHAWAQQLLAESDEEWMREPAFRLRTGAQSRWCSRNFSRYEREGRARRDAEGRRWWHASVRLPKRAPASDPGAMVEEIVDTFKAAS